MRLTEPLLKLPLTFDAERLATEIAQLPPAAWVRHPNALPGNAAVRLVTTNGQQSDDTAAPMAPTDYLRACPHVMGVMHTIGAVWGRSRLMRLAPGAVVPGHVDTHFYWRTHIRLHVPIVTNPQVRFTCDEETVHMAAGEAWIFDTFRLHKVNNAGTASRIHLVLDTVGGQALWDLIAAARSGGQTRAIAAPVAHADDLNFEQTSTAGVMSPWELRYHIAFAIGETRPDPLLMRVSQRLDRFAAGWTGVWAQHGTSPAGADAYQELIAALEAELPRLGGERLQLRNGLPLYRQLAELTYTLTSGVPALAGPRTAAAR